MVWNNVNITKAELEKKQKEYSHMAMEMAKRAQKSAPAAKTLTVTTTAGKTENNTAVHEAYTVITTPIAPAEDVIPAANAEEAENAEIFTDVQVEVKKSDNVTDEKNVEIKAVISEKSETANPTYAVQTEIKDESTSTVDAADYTEKTPEAVQTSESKANDEECADVSEEDPQKLFESVFISEEQADEKIEMMKSKKESAVEKAPDFNSYIQNHNRALNNCNCENCRKKREAAKHIQEKGGQKGTSY